MQIVRRVFRPICKRFSSLFQLVFQHEAMKDLCVELINRMFGVLGFIEVLWRLLWEVIWPPYDFKNIEGQTVLIAGVNSLSQGIARRLAKRGARLVFWDPNGDLLEDLSTEFEANDIETIVQTVNMSSYPEVEKAAKILSDQHKLEVDILINASGNCGPQFDFLKENAEFIDKMVDANVKSSLFLTHTFLPDFIRRRSGHLVTLVSTAGAIPTPHICDYSACEAATVAYIKSIEVDMLARGVSEIQFTTLNPSFIHSEFFKEAKFSGKILWDRIEADDACDQMVIAILTNRRSLILPWQDALLLALGMVLSPTRFHKVLARRWSYSKHN